MWEKVLLWNYFVKGDIFKHNYELCLYNYQKVKFNHKERYCEDKGKNRYVEPEDESAKEKLRNWLS